MHFYSFRATMSKNVINLKFRLEKKQKIWYDIIGIMHSRRNGCFYNEKNEMKYAKFVAKKHHFASFLQTVICIHNRFPDKKVSKVLMYNLKIGVGDTVITKKKHPCSTDIFKVLRVGSDIRLVCTGCDRDLTVSREKCERMIKKLLPAEADNT